MYRSSLALNRLVVQASKRQSKHTHIHITTNTHGASNLRTSSTLSKSTTSGGHENSSTNNIKATTALGLAGLSLCAGYAAGTIKSSQPASPGSENTTDRVLPSGIPRGCCSCDSPPVEFNLSDRQKALPSQLSKIVGAENVLSGLFEDSTNTTYLKGARLGRGKAFAIITPTTISAAVKALEAIVDADCIIIPQGQNTGLTGGSVPRDDGDDNASRRPTVIVNMRKLDTMFPIDDGTKVVCLAGSGIATLANNLPIWGFGNRESHSTLGSTFLNPTTAAGVAFGSGGTQLRKGPAYTDRALYAKVYQNKWGKNVVEVVNTLGIEGIEDKDFVNGSGSAVEQLDIYANDIKTGYTRPMAGSSDSVHGKAMASDGNYAQNVCECGDDIKGRNVSRCNADTKGQDCNRSEGKVLILATVHDTFPKASEKKSFWISCQDFETAQRFRKEVCLDNPKDLPISVEYMDRDSFDVIDRSGRILANLIKVVGVGSVVGMLWNVKLKIEALPFDGAETICDKLLHNFNNLTPAILPSRFMETGKGMDHHIAMSVGDFGGGEMDRFLERMALFRKLNEDRIVIHECQSSREEMSVTAFRFVAAPAFRTWCVGENVQGFSVDYAMPKNNGDAPLLEMKDGSGGKNDQQPKPLKRMRYSHFGCNVVHEDLAYALGVDIHTVHEDLKVSVSGCGGKLPAEHGHGTEYTAPKESQERWKRMDPLNVMNPGIGGLSSNYKYAEK